MTEAKPILLIKVDKAAMMMGFPNLNELWSMFDTRFYEYHVILTFDYEATQTFSVNVYYAKDIKEIDIQKLKDKILKDIEDATDRLKQDHS